MQFFFSTLIFIFLITQQVFAQNLDALNGPRSVRDADAQFSRGAVSSFSEMSWNELQDLKKTRQLFCSKNPIQCQSEISWMEFACSNAASKNSPYVEQWIAAVVDSYPSEKTLSRFYQKFSTQVQFERPCSPFIFRTILSTSAKNNWQNLTRSVLKNLTTKLKSKPKLIPIFFEVLITDFPKFSASASLEKEISSWFNLISLAPNFGKEKTNAVAGLVWSRLLATSSPVEAEKLVLETQKDWAASEDVAAKINLLAAYCFSQRLQAKPDECEKIFRSQKLDKLKASNLELSTQLIANQLTLGGKRDWKTLFQNTGLEIGGPCVTKAGLDWAYFFAAQYHRLNGELENAGSCFDQFEQAGQTKGVGKFLTDLEKIKLDRLKGKLDLAQKRTEEMKAESLTLFGSLNLMHVYVLFEELKNHAVSKNKPKFAKTKKAILNVLEGKNFVLWNRLVQYLEFQFFTAPELAPLAEGAGFDESGEEFAEVRALKEKYPPTPVGKSQN